MFVSLTNVSIAGKDALKGIINATSSGCGNTICTPYKLSNNLFILSYGDKFNAIALGLLYLHHKSTSPFKGVIHGF